MEEVEGWWKWNMSGGSGDAEHETNTGSELLGITTLPPSTPLPSRFAVVALLDDVRALPRHTLVRLRGSPDGAEHQDHDHERREILSVRYMSVIRYIVLVGHS